MKLAEIKINEALTANWSEARIQELSPAKLKALRINATKAGDEKVLKMIDNVVSANEKIQKQIAKNRRAEDKKWDRLYAKDNQPRKYTDAELQEIARKIEDVTGSVFPDGDPIDKLAPWIKKRFSLGEFGDVGSVLAAAAKKHLGSKDYYSYLADMWEDYIDDVDPERRKDGNPWK